MLITVAEVKGWHVEKEWVDDLEEQEWGAVRRLEENWKVFREGNHPPTRKSNHKKEQEWVNDSDTQKN